jgi:hypothetical protein
MSEVKALRDKDGALWLADPDRPGHYLYVDTAQVADDLIKAAAARGYMPLPIDAIKGICGPTREV